MENIEVIKLDCKGKRCPRPIIELAKAKKNSAIGTTIEITADDLAFESDVKAWCMTTGNKILDFYRDGNIVKVTIEICKKN